MHGIIMLCVTLSLNIQPLSLISLISLFDDLFMELFLQTGLLLLHLYGLTASQSPLVNRSIQCLATFAISGLTSDLLGDSMKLSV